MRLIFASLMLLGACQSGGSNAATATGPSAAVVALAPLAAASPTPAATATPALPRGVLAIANRKIPVDIAATSDSRRQGLSGRPSLAKDTGLILAWDVPTPVSIWMPDMNFPIDVIFVVGGKVVGIFPDAQPCPPEGPCPAFGPQDPVDFVAEVPAGSAAVWGLAVGAAASFTPTP